MPKVWSKPCRFFNENRLLAGVRYIDDLQNALIDIETCENPKEYASVTELFSLYITQRVSEAAGRPLWVCTFAFNHEIGSAWCDEY